jgi:hypothetical protein
LPSGHYWQPDLLDLRPICHRFRLLLLRPGFATFFGRGLSNICSGL